MTGYTNSQWGDCILLERLSCFCLRKGKLNLFLGLKYLNLSNNMLQKLASPQLRLQPLFTGSHDTVIQNMYTYVFHIYNNKACYILSIRDIYFSHAKHFTVISKCGKLREWGRGKGSC